MFLINGQIAYKKVILSLYLKMRNLKAFGSGFCCTICTIYSKKTILQWELFRLNELEYFDALLRRQYKQDLEQIVMTYEVYRNALNRELERRQKENLQQQQQQQQQGGQAMQLMPMQTLPLHFLQHKQLQQHLQQQHQQFHQQFQHQQQQQIQSQQQLQQQQQQQRLLTQNIETKV